MICVRKILLGEFGGELQKFFPLRDADNRRGHHLTIKKQREDRLHTVFRLSKRAVNNWNALLVSVVEEKSESLFKRKLDQHLERMWPRDWV